MSQPDLRHLRAVPVEVLADRLRGLRKVDWGPDPLEELCRQRRKAQGEGLIRIDGKLYFNGQPLP